MIKAQQDQDSEDFSVEQQEAPASPPVRLWREQVSTGQTSTCSSTYWTQANTFRETRCLSLVWLEKKTEPTWSLSSSKTHDTIDSQSSIFYLSLILSFGPLLTFYQINRYQSQLIKSYTLTFFIRQANFKLDLIWSVKWIDQPSSHDSWC